MPRDIVYSMVEGVVVVITPAISLSAEPRLI